MRARTMFVWVWAVVFSVVLSGCPENQAPTANAGADQSVSVGSTVTLDSSASSDPDGDTLTYAWKLAKRPVNSRARLTNATSVNPAFVADVAGEFVAELAVSDGKGGLATDSVTITAGEVAAAIDHSSFKSGCVECHNGTKASGKNANHPLTTDDCEACHAKYPARWLPLTTFDHAFAVGACSTCHVKPATHIKSDNTCNECHTTTAWLPATDPATSGGGSSGGGSGGSGTVTPVDHSTFASDCVKCHNGTNASGKSGLHLAGLTTTDVCEACHAKFPEKWKPAVTVDHAQVLGTCESCHNSVLARGKPVTHIVTDKPCETCHAANAWVPALSDSGGGSGGGGTTPGGFDHTGVTAPCDSCHNGTKASGKSATHIATTAQCDVCHSTSQWVPAAVDHSALVGDCASCHNGTAASGKAGKHLQGLFTSNQCERCHAVLPSRWVPIVTFDHTQTTVADCAACHNNVLATGKSATHVRTTAPCGDCHTTASWRPAKT